MKCPNCDEYIPDGIKYCTSCMYGTNLHIIEDVKYNPYGFSRIARGESKSTIIKLKEYFNNREKPKIEEESNNDEFIY